MDSPIPPPVTVRLAGMAKRRPSGSRSTPPRSFPGTVALERPVNACMVIEMRCVTEPAGTTSSYVSPRLSVSLRTVSSITDSGAVTAFTVSSML